VFEVISPNCSKSQSHTNYRHCNTEEKHARLADSQHLHRKESRTPQRVQSTVEINIEAEASQVDQATHDDLCTIMNSQTENVLSKCSEDSFQAIFWNKQLKLSACLMSHVQNNTVLSGGLPGISQQQVGI